MIVKYIAACFILVAVLLQQVRCAEDCSLLTKCMSNYGAQFKNVFEPANKESVKQFFDIVCMESNIDALSKCYRPDVISDCSSLQSIFSHQSVGVGDSLKDFFSKACLQKGEMISVIECIQMPSVGQSIARCSMSMTSDSDQQDQAAVLCSRMSTMMTCVEKAAEGQCSDSTVAFLKSNNKEQYAGICAASKMADNVFLLCILCIITYLSKY